MGSAASFTRSSAYKVASSPSVNQVNNVEWIIPSGTKLPLLSSKDFVPQTMIGKGKFGHVFVTKNTPTAKHCAVKYILKQIIFDCKAEVRIQQEIDIIQKVRHPFIVHCFGGFETEGCIALAFEYCPGGELYTRMKKDNPMAEQHAKFYFCEIAIALRYLHNDLNIVYRDLKPENILLDCGGHVKLCDFGFAVPLGVDNESLNDGCGTAMYVAPEIAEGFMKLRHGFPVDWWSLGCVLYEMVVGTPPFGDTDKMSKFEIFNNINSKSVSLPFRMNPALKTLIKGLLEKGADKRYSWNDVQSSEWVEGIPWEKLEKRQVIPPWVPTIPMTLTTENFVSWQDTIDPSFPANTQAANYCKSIHLSQAFKGAFSSGKGSSGRMNSRQQSSNNLNSNNGGNNNNNNSSSSSGSMNSNGSNNKSFGSSDSLNGNSPHPKPSRMKSSLVVLSEETVTESADNFSPNKSLPSLKVKRSNSMAVSGGRQGRRGSEISPSNNNNNNNNNNDTLAPIKRGGSLSPGKNESTSSAPSVGMLSRAPSTLGNLKRANTSRN